MSLSFETEKLLLTIFAQSNPVYTLERIQQRPDVFRTLKEYLFPPFREYSRKLFTFSNRIHPLFKQLGVTHQLNHETVVHVFPVVQEDLNEGFMVPLKIEPSDDWIISDAFGTFGIPSNSLPHEAFYIILMSLEKQWATVNPGKILPLRWRSTYAIQLQGMLHFDAIGGESLQVPLAIALLRTFAQNTFSLSKNICLPFGESPTFSTGSINFSTGQFGPVEGLVIKLRAFVREYGDDLFAILTNIQQIKLQNEAPELLKRIKIITANNLMELMTVDELRHGISSISSPPRLTEIDTFLELMFKMRKNIRFQDMKQIIQWLKPNISSPVYAFQLEQNLGLTEAHKGRFPKASDLLKNASEIVFNNSSYFGISEKIDLFTAWGTLAIDACDMNLAIPFMEDIKNHLHHATSSDRVKYWGTLCQLYRMAEQHDLSIAAGKSSIFFADMALASESGRDRNYLIHALIDRAKKQPSSFESDLSLADSLLSESCNRWLPATGAIAHAGFCLHLKAEITRLRGQGFNPLVENRWKGNWGHPWLFVLLSCVRNTENSWAKRELYSRELITRSREWTRHSKTSLFNLFHHIFMMYVDSMEGKPVHSHVKETANWCDRINAQGFSGWKNRLTPFLNTISAQRDPMASVDAMCNKFFYF